VRALAAIPIGGFVRQTAATEHDAVRLADAGLAPGVEIGAIGAGRPSASAVHREKAGVGRATRGQKKKTRTDEKARAE
jgi:hypothetical protein